MQRDDGTLTDSEERRMKQEEKVRLLFSAEAKRDASRQDREEEAWGRIKESDEERET